VIGETRNNDAASFMVKNFGVSIMSPCNMYPCIGKVYFNTTKGDMWKK
jgi:hypothetical protein